MAKLPLRRRLSLPPLLLSDVDFSDGVAAAAAPPPGALALEAQAPDPPRSAPCVFLILPLHRLLSQKNKTHSGANTQTRNVCRRPADPTELLLQRICSHIHTQAHTLVALTPANCGSLSQTQHLCGTFALH